MARPRRKPDESLEGPRSRPLAGFLTLALFLALVVAGVATYRDPPRPRAFQREVREGKVSDVERLLTKHPELVATLRDEEGWTPLHWAAWRGHIGVMDLLLRSRDAAAKHEAAGGQAVVADINARDDRGRTPLHVAAEMGHKSIVDMLINNGADPAIKDDDGYTPLQLAASRGREETAEMLLARERGGSQAAYVYVALGLIERMGPLLDKDPSLLNTPGIGGRLPLSWAARQGRSDTVEWLLAKGADIKGRNADGGTALHEAAAAAPPAMIELLRAHKADIAAVDHDGRTPLHRAAAAGNAGVIAPLLAAGAHLYARTTPSSDFSNGLTPLMLAALNNHVGVADALVGRMNDPGRHATEALLACAPTATPEMANLLLGKGADPSSLDLDAVKNPLTRNALRKALAALAG